MGFINSLPFATAFAMLICRVVRCEINLSNSRQHITDRHIPPLGLGQDTPVFVVQDAFRFTSHLLKKITKALWAS